MLLRGEFILTKLLVLEPYVKHWCFRFDWLWAILNFLFLFDWQKWDRLLAQLNMFNVTVRSQVPMSNLLRLLMSVCLYMCVSGFYLEFFMHLLISISISQLFYFICSLTFILIYWYNFFLSYQFSTFFYLFSFLILIKNNQNPNKKAKLTKKQNIAYLDFIFSVNFIFVLLKLSLETSMT